MTTIAKTTAAVLALALALPMTVHAQSSAMAVPAAKAKKAMTYDCSKAGNKNKASCKTAAAKPAAAVAAKPAMAAAAPSAGTAPAPKKSLFGGMMAAKPAAPKAAPKAESNNPNVVAYTTKTGKVIHYDCSKAGNKNKAACKGH